MHAWIPGAVMAAALYCTTMAAAAQVPPAAAILALHLHIGTRAIVGDQPRGRGGPWAIWLTTRRGSVEAAGQVLSTGPKGAAGPSHYYYPRALHHNKDVLHGRIVSASEAVKIARSWLRKAGVEAPRGKLHVVTGANVTVIGLANGLCCFETALTRVSWGGAVDQFGRSNASATVYVANGGTVVQADVKNRKMSPTFASGEVSSPCPGHTTRDRNAVAVGLWCFSYPAAADLQMMVSVGAHETWARDPRQIGNGFTRGSRIRGGEQGPLHAVSVTSRRAVYSIRVRGMMYRLTLVPAFPELPGSIWELTRVEHS